MDWAELSARKGIDPSTYVALGDGRFQNAKLTHFLAGDMSPVVARWLAHPRIAAAMKVHGITQIVTFNLNPQKQLK